MKKLSDSWIGYRTKVLREDAGPVQVDETRTAFYAGAACLFDILMGLDPRTSQPTEPDLEQVTGLQTELHAFAAELSARVRLSGWKSS